MSDGLMKNSINADENNHIEIGKRFDIFAKYPDVGQGLALWKPNGGMIRYLLERFSQEAHILNGYQWVYTPHIGRANLWKTSGHLDFYKESIVITSYSIHYTKLYDVWIFNRLYY